VFELCQADSPRKLEKQYPKLVRYYAATRRQVKPASLHLLYDTIKEYSLARGLAQGFKSPYEMLRYASKVVVALG
jgi:hypothetical protein